MNRKGTKHLTLDERYYICSALKQGLSCKNIAQNLARDDRTISYEIKTKRYFQDNFRNDLFVKSTNKDCPKLLKYPFVCNNCKTKHKCSFAYKAYYDAKKAQEQYEYVLVNSRIGLDITKEQFETMDLVLQAGVEKGQSIAHIVKNNAKSIPYSERHVYTLIAEQKLSIKKIDLKRAIRYAPRKHNVPKREYAAKIRTNRRYLDFLKEIAKNPFMNVVEMDTVESTNSGQHKCLLTLHFVNCKFMLIILLNSKTMAEVDNAFIMLQDSLGPELYKKLFSTILTDRGVEFCNPDTIECDHNTGEKLINVYFCDALSSWQKGAIEKNHEYIREVIPKGFIFDHLEQSHINMLSSHINSTYRPDADLVPYTAFKDLFGESTIKKLGIEYIDPNSIILKPELLR